MFIDLEDYPPGFLGLRFRPSKKSETGLRIRKCESGTSRDSETVHPSESETKMNQKLRIANLRIRNCASRIFEAETCWMRVVAGLRPAHSGWGLGGGGG